MTAFEEVLEAECLRAGMLGSLGCEQGESAEDAAAGMVTAWPRLAELWPTSAPGREVVSLGLIGGIHPRQFRGMEYPPLLPAVRWCLLTQGVVALELHPAETIICLPTSSEAYRDTVVRLLYCDGLPEWGAGDAQRSIEHLMRSHIGNSFIDLISLSTETIPHISSEWKRSYQLSWHLPTDRMSTTLSVTKIRGVTRENHRFELSSCSRDHLKRLIALVMPLMDGSLNVNAH
jgi:hypothetical protein